MVAHSCLSYMGISPRSFLVPIRSISGHVLLLWTNWRSLRPFEDPQWLLMLAYEQSWLQMHPSLTAFPKIRQQAQVPFLILKPWRLLGFSIYWPWRLESFTIRALVALYWVHGALVALDDFQWALVAHTLVCRQLAVLEPVLLTITMIHSWETLNYKELLIVFQRRRLVSSHLLEMLLARLSMVLLKGTRVFWRTCWSVPSCHCWSLGFNQGAARASYSL